MAAVPPGLATALRDRYHLDRELGRGGMATVYLAQDVRHDRKVAIKVLRPELAAAIGAERFLAEIKITAALQHPHILPLFDSGSADSFLFYVMPLVEGESLRDRLSRERQLPISDALRITTDVGAALDYAHRHGVIHRDIKPENILLQDGHALVADFGIALALEAAGGERLTATGFAPGTPQYMSPEQALGERSLDGRSDIYALGSVLYEMLAGEPPFPGRTAQAVIARRMTQPVPSVRVLRETVPEGIDRALASALAKAPADRFPTAGAFVEALAGAARAEPRMGDRRTTTGAASRRRQLIAVGGLIAAAALAVAFWGWRAGAPPRHDANLVAVAPFDVFEPSLQVYHEGFVDLLSRGIDGAGPLRTVAPTTVIRRWSGRSDRASATALGRRTGAQLVIVGQVTPNGADSVRITASLVDAASDKTLDQVQVRGPVNQADALADSVAVGVLGALARVRTIGAARSTSLGTKSLVALRAFLQGEQFFRRSAWDSARPHYERAVAMDSGFALAWNRLGTTRGWQGAYDESLDYRLKAHALNVGLAPRESLLILQDGIAAEGGRASEDSAAVLKGRRLSVIRHLVQRYPDDPEAWFQLGEALHHTNGGTATEEYQAWIRSITLDSAFAPSYFHVVELALQFDGVEAARRYADQFVTLNTVGLQRDAESEGTRLVALLLDSAGRGSPAIHRLLDTITTEGLAAAAFTLQRWPDSGETAVRLARRLPFVTTGLLGPLPAFRHGLLMQNLASRGHVREAAALRGPGARVGFNHTLTELALLGALPAESLAAKQREALANRQGWIVFSLPIWGSRRDTASLRALRRALPSPGVPNSGAWGGARRSTYLVAATDAWLALAHGDTATALARFQVVPDSLCLGCSFERLEQAQLLVAMGRNGEAMGLLDGDLFRAGYGMTPSEVIWTLLRGRVAERLGQAAKALKSYQYVVDFWRHADPELEPYVAEARGGLARLTAESR